MSDAPDNHKQIIDEVFVEEFEVPPEELRPDALIFRDLGLDSLDIVDLIVALQQRFGVSIREDERIRQVRTLQDLYDYIERLGNE